MMYVTKKDLNDRLRCVKECGAPVNRAKRGRRVSVVLDADLWASVDVLATRHGVTRQDVVRTCLSGYLSAGAT